MDHPAIPFNRPMMVGKELAYMQEAVITRRHISGNGFYTRACQDWLEQTLNVRKVLLTHSCTAALEMAMLLCDLRPGDEVIMPSFTFSSTANAVVLRGAAPVFVEIREDTANIDPAAIESAINSRTKAIIVVHYAGYPCDMTSILAIARRHKLFLIEDAAQAIFSRDDQGNMGTLGDLGCFSFHETKNIIAGEGGALLINNPAFIARAEILWEKGTDRARMQRGEIDKYTWIDVGSSFLPSDLIAAYLKAQLEEAPSLMHRRVAIHNRYWEELSSLVNVIGLPQRHEKGRGNGHIFYILTRDSKERAALMEYLRQKGIVALFHYIPLHSAPAGRKYGRSWPENLPVTDSVSSRLLRLPIYNSLRDDEVALVSSGIRSFYEARE